MAFDPSREPTAPRDAASVILIRARGPRGAPGSADAAEVFLLRRHRKASFMSSAFVFPGGAAEARDADPRVTAARELFEEAGVLLADRPVPRTELEAWRARCAPGASDGAAFDRVLRDAGVAVAVDSLHYFAHWITPSAESKRFSARFFVAILPEGQTPSFDNVETVDELWVTPGEALERAGELRLPPPQVRTLADMRDAAVRGPAALVSLAAERARHPHPVLPRFAAVPVTKDAPRGFALLLPWDPDYATAAIGEGIEMAPDHPLAIGPSRFILDGDTWKNVDAPGSPSAA